MRCLTVVPPLMKLAPRLNTTAAAEMAAKTAIRKPVSVTVLTSCSMAAP